MIPWVTDKEIDDIASYAWLTSQARVWRVMTKAVFTHAHAFGYRLLEVEKINNPCDFISVVDEIEIAESVIREYRKHTFPLMEGADFSMQIDADVNSGFAYYALNEILGSIWIGRKKILAKSIDGLGDAELIPEGRYSATIEDKDGDSDTNAVIGYDSGIGTYFCQAFEIVDVPPYPSEILLWCGTTPDEYPTLTSLKKAISVRGYRLVSWELEPFSSI